MRDTGTRSPVTTPLHGPVIYKTAACIAVLAFVIYRRRKAAENAKDSIENIPENGDEKQG